MKNFKLTERLAFTILLCLMAVRIFGQSSTLIPPEFKKSFVSGIIFDQKALQKVDWKFKPPQQHTESIYNFNNNRSGDINGDGFDDIIMITNNFPNDKIYRHVFYGSSSGLSDIAADVVQLDMNIDEFYVANVVVGDINGDGYDDVCHNGNNNYVQIFLGSASGLRDFPDRIIDVSSITSQGRAYIPYGAGDLNGDGYDDIILLFEGAATSGAIIYGGVNTLPPPVMWPSRMEEEEFYNQNHDVYINDFNNDGFSDAVYYYTLGQLKVYYGSPEGLSYNAVEIFNNSRISVSRVVTGNFDGDEYADLLVSYHEYIPALGKVRLQLVEIKGSSFGLDLSNIIVHDDFNGDGFWMEKSLRKVGDINNDGIDDFNYDKKIHVGSPGNSSQRFLSFYIGEALVGEGNFNGDGAIDISKLLNHSEIYYSPTSDPYGISCEEKVELCFEGEDKFYQISPAELSNSFFYMLNYWVYSEGEVNSIREGDSEDASGTFRDNSKIIWQAIGYNNISYTCITEFKFKYRPLSTVKIKEFQTVNPGGDPNTIYIGHGPNELRLVANASGGGPYQYLWSNNSTERNPKISERIPGEYTYWVKLTNTHGCTSSDSIIIKVENALCSSPLVDAVMQSYPMILQNNILHNLIKHNSKVAVCYYNQTLCLDRSVVDTRLSRPGYSLGACTPGIIPAQAFMTQDIEEILSGKLKVMVAPNPATTRFQLNIASITNESVSIKITDINGRVVEQINRAATNTTVFVGEKLRAGVYFAEVIAGNEREIIKLIKID